MARVRGDGASGGVEYYIRGYQHEGGRWAPTRSHRGRTASWIGVALILLGGLAAGLGMVAASWAVVIVAAVLAAAGAVVCIATDVFTDVVLDDPHRQPEEPHTTPLHRIKKHDREMARARVTGTGPG